MAGRRGQFLRHRLEHRPHERRDGRGGGGEPGGLLHAGLVPGFAQRDLLLAATGQKANNGYGWTQLWMADAEGKSRQLVYGEDGRHVYGGNVSPDGKYVLFTGNLQEDGDPGNAGAPMGLMRLSDAPIIGGESKELRALHPKVNNGPVLPLPAGWEPCWTLAELGSLALPSARGQGLTTKPGQSADCARLCRDDRARLANELHDQGWIAYSAKTRRGRLGLVPDAPRWLGTARAH